MLDHALEYLARGWSVIPIRGKAYSANEKDSKKTPLDSWKEFQSRLPTKEEVTSWFTKWPKANIAVITGKVSNLTGIDFDSLEAYDKYSVEWDLPNTLQSKPSRAFHNLYQYNPSLKNGALSGLKIDIKNDGGYIVLPPSVHWSGHTYSWNNDFPLSELPDIHFNGNGKALEKRSITSLIADGVSDGSRNDDMTRIAGALFKIGKLKRDDVYLACLGINQSQFVPPMDIGEVRSVVESVSKYHSGVTESISDKKAGFNPMNSNEILDMPDIPVPWIWDSFIASGMMFGLIASPKIGKSSFAYMLSVAMAQGKPFLGLQTKKTRILILALEEHKRDVAKRLVELGFQRGDPIFVYCDDMKLNPESVEILREYIVKESIGLLIVDTLAAFWTVKNENDNAETTQALNPLKFLAHDDKLNVAIGLIHHSGKSGTTRGATAIEAILDQIITLEKPDDSDDEYTKRTLRIKGRYSESPNKLVIDLEDDEYKVLGKSERVIKAKQRDAIIRDVIYSKNGATIEDIISATKITRKTVLKSLESLEFKRDIFKDGEGTRGNPFLYKKQIYSNDLILGQK